MSFIFVYNWRRPFIIRHVCVLSAVSGQSSRREVQVGEESSQTLNPAQNFAMLVLYETPLGLCLFKLTDAGKLEKDSLWEEFQTPERAASL